MSAKKVAAAPRLVNLGVDPELRLRLSKAISRVIMAILSGREEELDLNHHKYAIESAIRRCESIKCTRDPEERAAAVKNLGQVVGAAEVALKDVKPPKK